ncbi:MAG: N-acetylmuramoyl-L-alanine amidase [Marinilabiliaceae bacterium]|jgi:N-acetylmuramoyl-L-alanine amidase|nr:N-acetylmuramoyl-L-alanine amidase [Marinilabiliaceae bacterium]
MRRSQVLLLLISFWLIFFSGVYAPAHVSIADSAKTDEPLVRYYDIFGSKYSKVEIKDNSLEGAVYYLMSGHGGPDPGALGKYGPYILAEDEYAYDVTLRLARRLIEHGALVYLITRDNNDGIRDQSILARDKDERCYPAEVIPVNQMARLRQRTNAVNRLYRKYRGRYQRLVVLHLDSSSSGENIDVYFYHHQHSRPGYLLANNIHNAIEAKYREHQPNRPYHGTVSQRSGLYVIRNTHPPTVFIELGNIRNARDQRRFVLADNRQALANWIGEGIEKDYESR